MLSKAAPSTIFWVFGMTRPGIESKSPGLLANTLLIRPKLVSISCLFVLSYETQSTKLYMGVPMTFIFGLIRLEKYKPSYFYQFWFKWYNCCSSTRIASKSDMSLKTEKRNQTKYFMVSKVVLRTEKNIWCKRKEQVSRQKCLTRKLSYKRETGGGNWHR